jgi:hypothetical protein
MRSKHRAATARRRRGRAFARSRSEGAALPWQAFSRDGRRLLARQYGSMRFLFEASNKSAPLLRHGYGSGTTISSKSITQTSRSCPSGAGIKIGNQPVESKRIWVMIGTPIPYKTTREPNNLISAPAVESLLLLGSRQGAWVGDLAQGFAAEFADAFEVIPIVAGDELIISMLVFTRFVLITAHTRTIDANRHMIANKPL